MDVVSQDRNDPCKAGDLSLEPCGILRLPSELLADISCRVVSLYMADVEAFDAYEIPVRSWPPIIETPRPPRSHHYRWIVVSHICSRWRKVTLAIPRMWPTIVLSYNMMWVKTPRTVAAYPTHRHRKFILDPKRKASRRGSSFTSRSS